MDSDVKAVLGLGALPARQRTPALIERVLSPEFVSSHPALVRMLADPALDAGLLRQVMDKFQSVKIGRIDEQNASIQIGEALVSKFVKQRSG